MQKNFRNNQKTFSSQQQCSRAVLAFALQPEWTGKIKLSYSGTHMDGHAQRMSLSLQVPHSTHATQTPAPPDCTHEQASWVLKEMKNISKTFPCDNKLNVRSLAWDGLLRCSSWCLISDYDHIKMVMGWLVEKGGLPSLYLTESV